MVMPTTIEDAAAILTDPTYARRSILVRGGGTKWDAAHRTFADSNPTPLIMSTANLTGILDYDPGELTITARAGTRLAMIAAELEQHGQYLPFDPPFVALGATLGGTVAAGLSGPRRMRYGGLRDFVIGIEYLSADGQRVRGGGKVVKNAAGYDLPKLFCGSMGALGMLVSVSFKVFPAPQGSRTLLASVPDIVAVKAAFRALQSSPAEVSAVEAWPQGTVPNVPDLGAGYTLAVLIEGAPASLEGRVRAVRGLLPPGASTEQINTPEAQADLWTALRDLTWLGQAETVLRLYLPSSRAADLDAILRVHGARYAFSLAGNVAWAALSGDPARLSSALAANEISAAVWRSPVPAPEVLPVMPGAAMAQRVKQALDPRQRFFASTPGQP
jgi:glycolate oxidase FAD binding subunit